MKQNKPTEQDSLAVYLRDKYGALMTPDNVHAETGIQQSTLAKWRCYKTNISYTNLGTGRGSPPRYTPASVAEFMLRNMVEINAA